MRKTPRHRQSGRPLRPADRIGGFAGGLTGAILAGALTGSAAAAEAPKFAWPVDCVLGQSCYIQKYVDRDPGPGWKDFACGGLTNDKHSGTDIAVYDYKVMQRGVAVRAAAPGKVTGIRDGVPDVSVRDGGMDAVQTRECGNGVAIDHGEGWHSQYCHLRRGSISVRRGEFVQAGDQVGLIGLSGATEYPHVHFEVRRERKPIDPFDGAPMGAACGTSAPQSLWAQPMAYTGAGVINIGFTGTRPSEAAIDSGDLAGSTLERTIPNLIFFVRYFGLRAGDREAIDIIGPDNKILARLRGKPAPRNLVRALRWFGVKPKGETFAPGVYRAEFKLRRADGSGDTLAIETTATVTLR